MDNFFYTMNFTVSNLLLYGFLLLYSHICVGKPRKGWALATGLIILLIDLIFAIIPWVLCFLLDHSDTPQRIHCSALVHLSLVFPDGISPRKTPDSFFSRNDVIFIHLSGRYHTDHRHSCHRQSCRNQCLQHWFQL